MFYFVPVIILAFMHITCTYTMFHICQASHDGSQFFVLGGLALIGLGIAALLKLTDVLNVITSDVNSIPITIIVLGAIVFLIAFLGCCGAIWENRCFLTLYGICMLLLAAGKIYVVVVVFQNLKDVKDTVTNFLQEAFERTDIREQCNAMESTFQCCGTTGPNSYFGPLPVSCCPRTDEFCTRINAFEGCNEIIGDFFEYYGEVIGIIVGIIVALELLTTVLTFYLCSTIGGRRKTTV